MTRFFLLVNYDNGVVPTEPMLNWDPADIKAHLAYYEALNAELTESRRARRRGGAGRGRRRPRSSGPTGSPRRS